MESLNSGNSHYPWYIHDPPEKKCRVIQAHDLEVLWWSLAMGACLGGNGTLLGASANLTVAAFAEKAKQPIGFLAFAKIAFPIMLLTLVIANIYIWLRYFY